jgi:hypothetical protein
MGSGNKFVRLLLGGVVSEPRKSLGRELAATSQGDRLRYLVLGFLLLPVLGLGFLFFVKWFKKSGEIQSFLRNAREGRARVHRLEYVAGSASASLHQKHEPVAISIQYSVLGEPAELRVSLRGEAAFKHARNVEAILRKNFREMEVVGVI